MAIEKYAGGNMVINGVPIIFTKNYAYIDSIVKTGASSVNILMPNANNVFYLGSSLPQLGGKTVDSVIQSNKIETRYDITLVVENQGAGKYITDLLTPLTELTDRLLRIPCQFYYGGFYIALGYIENMVVSYPLGENRYIYNFSIVENIYKTFMPDNPFTYASKVGTLNNVSA